MSHATSLYPVTVRSPWRRVVATGRARAAAAALALLLFASVLAALFGGDRHLRQELAQARRMPSFAAPLGTDALGRSLLARCLVGGAVSLSVGAAAAAFALVVGVAWGSAAALIGGRIDAAMMRIVDVLYGLPYLLMVILLKVALDGLLRARLGASPALADFLVLLLAIGGVSWLTLARIVRSSLLALTAQPFVEAARAIGLPPRLVWWRHLLPNLAGPIVVYGSLTVPQAILQESFLGFLGVGIQPPVPTWGGLASEGLVAVHDPAGSWWLLLFPAALLSITLISMNLLGDAIRAAFDPRSVDT